MRLHLSGQGPVERDTSRGDEFGQLLQGLHHMVRGDFQSRPVRGGTDGARLSFMGLPCPNLGTGGYGFHGPYEHISVEGMQTAVSVIKNIVTIVAESDL